MVHRTGAHSLARLLAAGILTIAALGGCAGVFEHSAALPVRHAVVLDQLVIHTDFRMPKQDRLFDDLRALRETMRSTLALQPTTEPIHIYLFENELRFKAYLAKHYPDFPARRAFFLQTENTLAVYAQWGDRVAEDLRHEVAHGYLHASFPTIPLWLDEGLAEYFETPRLDAGLNRPHVALLQTLTTRDGWQPNLARLEQFNSVAEMQQADYAESWAWIHMLLETIPPRRELLQKYLREMRRDGSFEPLSAYLARSLPDADQVVRQHLADLTKK
ncbi:MAG TPA: DUF1570 domain-containing protein [Pirellulales bacterium]